MIEGYRDVDWKNKEQVIEFCETNKLYLDNYQSITNKEAQIHIINIKLLYCDALLSKGHYSECLDSLAHLNIMFKKLKDDPEIIRLGLYKKFLYLVAPY